MSRVARTPADCHDLIFEFVSLPVVLPVGAVLRCRVHRLGEERDECSRKRRHLFLVRCVPYQFLHVSQEVSVAVLDLDRDIVVTTVPVDDEEAGKLLAPEDALRDRCRPRILEEEDGESSGAEEPGEP